MLHSISYIDELTNAEAEAEAATDRGPEAGVLVLKDVSMTSWVAQLSDTGVLLSEA